MQRGQTTIEYMLGLSVLVLGVLSVLGNSVLPQSIHKIYIHVVRQIGPDEIITTKEAK